MEPIFVFFLILIPLVAAGMVALTWGAYTGRSRILWIRAVRIMIGGKYWFVLSPSILVLTLAAIMTMILLRVRPSTENLITNPGNPVHTTLLIVLWAGLLLAFVASYWLPKRLKPGWLRHLEADERTTQQDRDRQET